jgi:hypothetical protein
MDITSSTSQVAPEHKSMGRTRSGGRVKQFLLRGAASLVIAATLAQWTYTYSGSNQWENLGARRGVTVYAMKAPGSNIKKFKAVWRLRSTLSKFVMFCTEEESDLTIGYYDMRDLDAWGPRLSWSSWKQRMPSPLKPREFVMKTEFFQDPKTKSLLYTVTADPDKLPPDGCCVRLTVMTNSWRLTPLQDGQIDVEWFVDMDMGGVLPYFMQNSYQPEGMYNFARKVQGFLDRPKYKNARYDWIEELVPLQHADLSPISVAVTD